MIVLWGFKHYGKCYFTSLFRYNRKTVVQMQIGGEYRSHKWEYHGQDQHYTEYSRFIDEDNIAQNTRVDTISSEELLVTNTDIGIRIIEVVIEDWWGHGKKTQPFLLGKKIDTDIESKRKLHPIYADHGSKWSDHFFNDLCTCDLFVPQPHNSIWYEPFIDHFKKSTNLFPYKSDVLDVCIQRVNMFDTKTTNKYMNTNVKDVEDAYYTDKEIVFSHLDFYIKNSRDVESKLREYQIPYELIDLDTHNPKDLVDVEIPRRHGEVVPVSRDNERYKLATRIAKEYIKTRGLTDLRLSGRVHDKI